MNTRIVPVLLLFFVLSLASCTAFKDVLYFQDHRHTEPVANIPKDSSTDIPHRISFGDAFTLTFNTPLQTASNLNNNNTPLLLTVKSDSTIELPILGSLKVIGMTVDEANDSILARARIYFNQPFVNFLFVSFKITVLGEVKAPGIKSIKSENATLTEALAESGDLTEYANRKNIKIIRGDSVYYLDITDIQVMKSKAYFLKSNDIIYIQPLKKKNIMSNFATTFTFLSVLNFLTSVTTTVLYLTR